MERIKQIIKSNKYVPIDMTKKISDIIDIQNEILMKAHNSKYNKVVFMVDVKQMSKKTVKILQLLSQLPPDDYKEYVLLYNKDNYQFVNKNIDFSDASITSFFLDSDSACNICFEQDLNNIKCQSCCIQTCFKCFVKMGMPNVCCVCKRKSQI